MKSYAAKERKQISTPNLPDPWFNKLYFKSDNKAYRLDSNGNEHQLWGGDVLVYSSFTTNDGYAIEAYNELKDKMLVPFISDVANIWPATMNYWGSGNRDIVNIFWGPLVDDDINANSLVFLKYESHNDRFVLLKTNESAVPVSSIIATDVTYNITNWTLDRDFNADTTSINELIDVVYSLVTDLESWNVFWSWTVSSVIQTYIVTNVSWLRTFDANNTNLNELADVVGTIIIDIQNVNMFNGWVRQQSGQTYTVTNWNLDRDADADSIILNELSDIISSIIADLKNTNFIL